MSKGKLMRKRITILFITATILIPTTPVLAHHKPVEQFKCPKAMRIALQVGFKKKDLKTLDRIVHRESKCITKAMGWNYHKPLTHRNCKLDHWKKYRKCKAVKSADFGLTQINDRSWVTYLTQKKIITKVDDLLDARTNMRAAKALYDYSLSKGHHAWKQWDTSKPNGSR
jgi:hypothetical protein